MKRDVFKGAWYIRMKSSLSTNIILNINTWGDIIKKTSFLNFSPQIMKKMSFVAKCTNINIKKLAAIMIRSAPTTLPRNKNLIKNIGPLGNDLVVEWVE